MAAETTSASDAPAQPRLRALVRRLPRPETIILLLAFVCTAATKLVAVSEYKPWSVGTAWIAAVVSDVAFFAAVCAIIAGAYALKPSRLVTRCAMFLSLLVLGWSALNAAWLLRTGVQLQPSVLLMVAHHPSEFWPTVSLHAARMPFVTGIGVAALLALAVWAVWRIARPKKLARDRRRQLYRVVTAVAVLIISTVSPVWLPPTGIGSLGEVLSFSSHAYAISSLFMNSTWTNGAAHQTRHLPHAGGREVGLPATEPGSLPNVVVLLLESISYEVASLGDPNCARMPALAQLADEGVEFVNTRVPVPQTGKAFWSVLTGTTPDVYQDYSEAVLVDKPYEALPTLLRRAGYRSAFFQMAMGTFECAPGTFANFGFDWAWFLENLEDPSARVGPLSGDDFRMLDPALEWAEQDDRPFFLMMITSVAHDPYEVPSWFAPPGEDEIENHALAVQFTDAFVAELCRRLDERGLTDNTLLCLLGDHGDSLRPETRHIRWVPYEEVLRVPWVIRWPNCVPAGLRCEWPCSEIDVTPTILALLGYDISKAGFEGRDAMIPSDPFRRLYFASWYRDSPRGFVEGYRKWLYWPRSGEVFEYDLWADPQELSPLTVTGPERDRIIADVTKWQEDSYIEFDAKRFRKRFLYEHWWAFSSGRYARAYYVP